MQTIVIVSICIGIAAYFFLAVWHSITPPPPPTDEDIEQGTTRKQTIIKKLYND